MANSSPEGMTYSNIRQTIRELIFPLVQAIYEENPSDMILFCYDYFNNLLNERNSNVKNMSQIRSCVREITEEKKVDQDYQTEESEPVDNLPAYISASAPILTAEKSPRGVNLRETSSWDTPANITEAIRSLAVLEDVVCGIGDQSTPVKSQKENEAETCNTSLKHDSAFEDDSFCEHKFMSEVKNDSKNDDYVNKTDSHNEHTDKTLKTLCTEFQRLKVPDSLKQDDLRYDDSDQGMESTDINLCRKQLSPNSSFGFIPHIKECDSEKEMKKMDYEDLQGENFKAETRDSKAEPKKMSESFSNLVAGSSSSETNFNAYISNEKEMCDVIQGRNETNSTRSDQILGKRKDTEEITNEIISITLDKHELGNIKNNDDKEVFSTIATVNRNTSGYTEPGVNLKEHEGAKEDLTEPIDLHLDKFSDKEKPKATSLDDNDDDKDKPDDSESQMIVDKSWRKRWYEAHPPISNFSRFQSRDPRLHRARFPAYRPKIGEAGDVPVDRFYIPNGVSNINCRPRNQTASGTSAGVREFGHTRFLSDEINHRSNSARPFDSSTEKKTSSEKISNANPKNIPYSWRKSCKQSRSSENVVNYSEEPQANSNEEINNSANSTSEVQKSSLNEAEKSSGINVNEDEDIFFEASEKSGIKGSNEENFKQHGENGQKSNIHDAEQDNIMDDYTDCKDKTQSDEHFYNQDGIIRGQSATEKDRLAQICKQSATENGMEMKTKDFIHNGILLHAHKDMAVNQHNGDSLKDKFDLGAGCGDFVPSYTNGQDMNSESAAMELEENNITEQNNENNGPISREFLEEAIERAFEQQNNDSKVDSYEGLNLSSYSESDSSYIELSDCSEAEDYSLNDSLQDN